MSKKIILLLITLTTFTNVSYASFPVLANTIISIDTNKTDTTQVAVKETTEKYHLRMEKEGFDIESCMCESCRVTKSEKINSDSKEIKTNFTPLIVTIGVWAYVALMIFVVMGLIAVIKYFINLDLF